MNTQQLSTIVPTSNAVQAYSIEAFCERFGLGRSNTYEKIRLGRLQVRKIGSRTLIAHEDVNRHGIRPLRMG